MTELVEKPSSIARLLSNSTHIQSLFDDFKKKCRQPIKVSQHLHDLAFAPQRYASEAKTLSRLVLLWDSVLAVLTAVPTWRGPRSTEGSACLDTLRFLSEERLLLLGMMADAALQLSQLVHTFDSESFEECELSKELDHYREIVRKLFVEGMCLSVPGCTKVMMSFLEELRCINVSGVSLRLGGLTEAVKKSCLNRMACYVCVMEKVLEAEFPSWELMSAWSVFSLDSAKKRQPEAILTSQRKLCLQKLAQAAKVDEQSLEWEFAHFEPIASKFFHQERLSTFAAWRKAITSTAKSRGSHSCEAALLPCLWRLGAWSSSSCDVERGFGKAQAAKQIGQSQDEHLAKEQTVLILQQDVLPHYSSEDVKGLVFDAMKLWNSLCGKARQSGQTKRSQRWDAGLPRTGFGFQVVQNLFLLC